MFEDADWLYKNCVVVATILATKTSQAMLHSRETDMYIKETGYGRIIICTALFCVR